MVNDRRARVPGASYFFTVTLRDRRKDWLIAYVDRLRAVVRDSRGEHDLWQRRSWEHLIRDDHDRARHVDYIHDNPVKHGLVADPFDWRWSSIQPFARRGIVGRASRGGDQDGPFGD